MEYIEKLNIYTEQLNSDDIFEMDNLDDYHHILQKLTQTRKNNEKINAQRTTTRLSQYIRLFPRIM